MSTLALRISTLPLIETNQIQLAMFTILINKLILIRSQWSQKWFESDHRYGARALGREIL